MYVIRYRSDAVDCEWYREGWERDTSHGISEMGTLLCALGAVEYG